MKSKLQSRINQAEHLIIIGPQPFSKRELAKTLKNKQLVQVIYIDGGTIHREQIEKKHPELCMKAFSIGDSDSSRVKLDVKKSDQIQSDLAFLLKELGAVAHIQSLDFFGFMNNSIRQDHILANIGEVLAYQQKSKITRPMTMEGKLHFLMREKVELNIQQTFSLMTVNPCKIELRGNCHYPFKGVLSPLSSRGLSNVGFGQVTIKVSNQCLLILS